MCGRFATGLIAASGDDDDMELVEWLGLDPGASHAWPEASWNVAPTDPVPVVRGARSGIRRVDRARWGLVPDWWRKSLAEMKATTFNARSEEAHEKPMFRDAWMHGRCLIPAIGYYEWTGRRGDKTPWFVSIQTNAPGFCMAGLWAAPLIDGKRLLTATILTTAAGPATAHLHPRSPVVLAEKDWEAWLSREDVGAGSLEGVMALMRPPDDGRVMIHQVSGRVSRVGEQGASLIEPVGLAL